MAEKNEIEKQPEKQPKDLVSLKINGKDLVNKKEDSDLTLVRGYKIRETSYKKMYTICSKAELSINKVVVLLIENFIEENKAVLIKK